MFLTAPFTFLQFTGLSLRAGLSEPYCFSFFLFPVSIPPCLCYRFPPPLSHWALCDSNGAWTKLWSNQRCFIKCFRHVFCMEGAVGRLRGFKWTFLKCKNQTMTHKQKICIAGYRRSLAYEWTDSYTERDKALHEKRGGLESVWSASGARGTSHLYSIILSLVFLNWSFTFPPNPTSHHFTFRPFNRMFHETLFCKRCSTNWRGVE